MFTTQLNGLFKKIQENQIESIEDGAGFYPKRPLQKGLFMYMGQMKWLQSRMKQLRDQNHLTLYDFASG